jgi:transcriptional regulator with XRE-family HTH domain
LVAAYRKGKTPPWTQVDLARKSAGSLSRSAIANIESGRQRISLFQLYEVAATLGISPSELLPSVGTKPQSEEELLENTDPEARAFLNKVREGTGRSSVLAKDIED